MTLDLSTAQQHVQTALQGATDGELFIEHSSTQVIALEDSHIRTCAFHESQGFGLRRIHGQTSHFIHSNKLTEQAIAEAAKTLSSANNTTPVTGSCGTPHALYPAITVLEHHRLEERIALLQRIDAYVRTRKNNTVQVFARITINDQRVSIVRSEGAPVTDIRPLVRLDISVSLKDENGLESGYVGQGGRYDDSHLFLEDTWQKAADEAIRQAEIGLISQTAPAGEMPVVLAHGWSGVLFHEAVGHGLEGDFNRKGTSAFSGKIGKQVAAKGVNVVDDGTIANRRGSLNIDDEGTPTQRNVLVEDGILVGYMQDRLNARLMDMALTGNGRRESYAYQPYPRMTNTFLDNGTLNPEDILADTPTGIYAKTLGGGQVDITSGDFVFEVQEAYLIENGKLTTPIKGATLIGNGPETLKHIDAIGNDLALDLGNGICGKQGQSIPAGVGQPTCRVQTGITVGGTTS